MPTWTVEGGAGAGTTVTTGGAGSYLPDTDFTSDMDQDFGAGNWTQTGGWRSQSRENQLRAQGAQTVRPGQISQHSLGTEDAPGARDVVVRGETPAQAAQRLRSAGNLPYGQLYPEGSAGGQGAHLHIGMQAGTGDQTWTIEAGAGADPAATAAAGRPTAPAAPGYTIEGGAGSPGYQAPSKHDLLSSAGSIGGALLEGGGEIVQGLLGKAGEYARAQGALATALGAAPKTPENVAYLQGAGPQPFEEAGAKVAGAAQGAAAQIEPAQRTPWESFLHGLSGFVPMVAAAELGGPAGVITVMGAQGAGQATQEAAAKGATQQQQQAAASEASLVQGAIGLVPFGGPGEAVIAKWGAKGLWAAGARTMNAAIANSVMTGASQLGSNAVAALNYDADRPVFEGVPQAMFDGLVIGFGLHGATEAWQSRPKGFLRPTPKPPAAVDPKTGKVDIAPDKYNDGKDRLHFGPDPDLPPSPTGSGMPTSQAAARYYAEHSHDDDGAPAVEPRPPPPFNPYFPTPPATPSPLEPAPGPTPTAQPVRADYAPAGMPEPVSYESERVKYGAPSGEMPQAISDVDEMRRAQPRGTSLFDAIKSLGKMRTRDANGDPYTDRPDLTEGLSATKGGKGGRDYSTTFHIINNREGKGLAPHGMAMALAERGWFGDEIAADPGGMGALEAFETAFNNEASGQRLFHPDDTDNQVRARRADLERQSLAAGVTGADSVETASAKLAAWRGQEALKDSVAMNRLRAQADELGVRHTDASTYDDLKGDVDERLAIQGEAHPSELIDGEHVDAYERDTNVPLTQAEHEWLSRAYEGAGGEPEAAGGAGAAGREPAPGGEPAQGHPQPGEVAGGDRAHAQGVPEGARLAHIDPRAIMSAYEMGYRPFFSRLDDVEQAAADRQHFTVPIDEYHREVGGAAYEDHIRRHTHFQEAPTPEDEEEFLARHGATAEEAGETSPLEGARHVQDQARRAAAHTRRQARLREIYREKIESGELRPRTPAERDELAAIGHDGAAQPERPPDAHTEAARQVVERRAAREARARIVHASARRWRAAADHDNVEDKILAGGHAGGTFRLPGGRSAQVNPTGFTAPEHQWRLTVRDADGNQDGPDQLFGNVTAAAAIVAHLKNDYDFIDTFPPVREDYEAERQGPYAHDPDDPGYAEEERGLHEETARALRTDLNDVRAIESMGDIDPANGRRIPDTERGAKRREQLHDEARRAMWNYEQTLNDYEDHFGGVAREAFEAFVQLSAEDAFEGRLTPEADAEPLTPTQSFLTGIQGRTAELEADAEAARGRGDDETADRLQATADDMSRRAQAEADAEQLPDSGGEPAPAPTPDDELVPGVPVHPPTEPMKFTLAGPKGKEPLANIELQQLPDGTWTGRYDAGTNIGSIHGNLYHPGREAGGNDVFPTREAALSHLLDIVEQQGISSRGRSDSVASDRTRKQGERIVKWVEAQRKAQAERQKAAVADEDSIALQSHQAQPRPTETMRLGHQLVEQNIIPGTEPSARQAQAARGEGGLRPSRVQREAGPGDLFGPAPEPELGFGQPPAAPERPPLQPGQLPRTGAERWDAEMRAVDAAQAVKDTEALLTYNRSAEARRTIPKAEREHLIGQLEARLAQQRAELEAARAAQGFPPPLPAANEAPIPDEDADNAFFGTRWEGRTAERNQAIRWSRANAARVFGDDIPPGAEDDPTQWGHYARDHYRASLIHYKRIVFDVPENDYARIARRPLDESQAETWEERAEEAADTARSSERALRIWAERAGTRRAPDPRDLEATRRENAQAKADFEYAKMQLPGEWEPDRRGPRLQRQGRNGPADHPDLFSLMEPITERPSTGVFATPAEDRGKLHFDQNHADLNRLGRLAQRKGATRHQLFAEASRLADEMGAYMDWTDAPGLSGDERRQWKRTGVPTPSMMLKAARRYVHDQGEVGTGQPLYDSERYGELVRRWYEQEGGQRPKLQRAWHGGRADFDRFDPAFMGTGEGFQARGWGFYFGQLRKVAEFYRRTVAGYPRQTLGNMPLEALTQRGAMQDIHDRLDPIVRSLPMPGLDARLEAARSSWGWASLAAVLNRIREGNFTSLEDVRAYAHNQRELAISSANDYDQTFSTEAALRARIAEALADSGKLGFDQPGRLYRTEIPDHDEMLHLDEPLTGQPPKVRQALERIGQRLALARYFGVLPRDVFRMDEDHVQQRLKDVPARELTNFGLGRTGETRVPMNGEDYYGHLARELGRETLPGQAPTLGARDRAEPEQASRLLAQHGVPAARYPDEESRGLAPDQGTSNYVVYDPDRIDIQAKLQRQPRFYSAVERLIERSPQQSATAEQWLAMLKGAKGIKKEELEWMGLPEWLAMFTHREGSNTPNEPVTKAAIQAFVRDNGVKVEEVLHGSAEPHIWTADETAEWEAANARVREADEAVERVRQALLTRRRRPLVEAVQGSLEEYDLQERLVRADRQAQRIRDEREDLHAQIVGPEPDPARYTGHTTPGGVNQRELMLTLPDIANPPGTHWTTPGVFAHVRFSERETPDGKKVLYVEEVQSDWHQKGREEGYGSGVDQARVDRANQAWTEAAVAHGEAVDPAVDLAKTHIRSFIDYHQDLARRHDAGANQAAANASKAAEEGDNALFALALGEMQNMSQMAAESERLSGLARELYHQIFREYGQGEDLDRHQAFTRLEARRAGVFGRVLAHSRIVGGTDELANAWRIANETKQRLAQAHDEAIAAQSPQGVAQAPFKSSWPALVMKRVTSWAAEHGFDRVAWTSGNEQADRYGQRHHVGALRLEHRHAADIREEGFGGGTGRLVAYDPDGSIAYVKPLRHLGDLRAEIGPELTERLMAITPDTVDRTPSTDRNPVSHVRPNAIWTRELTGLDEHFGGHGMRVFYDRMLANHANDIIRPTGGKVTHEPVLLGDARSGRGPLSADEWKTYLSDFRKAAGAPENVTAKHAGEQTRALENRANNLWREAEERRQAGPQEGTPPNVHRMIVQDLSDQGNKASIQSRHWGRLADAMERYERLTPDRAGFDVTDKLRDAAAEGFPLFQEPRPGTDEHDLADTEWMAKGLRGKPIEAGEHSELVQQVEDEVRRLAPSAEVKGFEKIREHEQGAIISKPTGVTYRKLMRDIVAWSLESPDKIVTARHEVIHWLRRAGPGEHFGFFTGKEWLALEKMAVKRGWLDIYNIAERYPDEGWEQHLDEAIAEAFGHWRKGELLPGGKAPPFAREMFTRLHNLLEGVARVARKMLGASPTAEDVFHAIEGGKLDQRTAADLKRLERGAKAPEPPKPPGYFAERSKPTEEAQLQAARRRGGPPGYTPITEGPEEKEPGLPFERGVRGRIVDTTVVDHLRRISGSGMDTAGHKIDRAAAKLFGEPGQALNDALREAVNPMARGSARAQDAAKRFANALREVFWEHGQVDQFLLKSFPRDERKLMYEAADQESVLRQRGLTAGPDQGLNRLNDKQRAAVEELQKTAAGTLALARQVGITETEGLPSYVPRMVVKSVMGQPTVLAREPPQKPWMVNKGVLGRNLVTTTGQMRQRKYETLEQTEAAAKKAFGDKAYVVRDIRTLALANRRLNQAIAGKILVDRIKEIGDAVGVKSVMEGGRPDPELYFTIPTHPALNVWKPAFGKDEDGKVVPVTNPDGSVHFEQHPLWISKEFEGPLRAVLSTPTNDLWKAAMNIKSKVVGVVMYSPLMHNAVLWGKALPATGWKAFGPIYFEGQRWKNDPAIMREAINAGLAPIGRNFHTAELSEIAAEPGMAPGESWVGQLIAKVPQLYDKSPEAGERTMAAIDKLSDVWHNGLLWDKVASLQMGIYVNMRNSLVKHSNELGIHPDDAQKIAAHFANRYAGALPMEAMSKAARMTANTLLFSRSFTLGNIGTYKDMVAGLPTDVQAQIGTRGGPEALASAQGIARRKAASMFIADVTLQYVGYALAAAAIYAIHQALGDRGWKIKMPWQNPTDKQNRVLAGYNADGTAFYIRLPTGKVAEDLLNWFTHPRTTFMNKANPIPTRMVLNVLANDKGFGQKIWQPDAPFGLGTFQNLARVAWQSASDILPEGQIKAFSDMMSGRTDLATGLLGTLLPVAGITISHGPNPALADLYQEQDRLKFQLDQELPQLQQKWRDAQKELGPGGDRAKAIQLRTEVLQRYRQLGVPPALARYYSRIALNPQKRISREKLRAFLQSATPQERQQFQSDMADERAYESSAAAPSQLDAVQ